MGDENVATVKEPTIKRFIDRFRNASPAPREEREKQRQQQQPDFWWKHGNASSGGATAANATASAAPAFATPSESVANGAVTTANFDPRASFASFIPDTPNSFNITAGYRTLSASVPVDA